MRARGPLSRLASSPPAPPPLPFVPQYPFLEPIVERVLPRAAVELSVASVYGDASRIAPGVVDRYYDMARRPGNRRALFGRMAARREEQCFDASRLQAIAAPTLVIWGGRDDLIPVGEAWGGSNRCCGGVMPLPLARIRSCRTRAGERHPRRAPRRIR